MLAAACQSIAGHTYKIQKSNYFKIKVNNKRKIKEKLNIWMYDAASKRIAGHTFMNFKNQIISPVESFKIRILKEI